MNHLLKKFSFCLLLCGLLLLFPKTIVAQTNDLETEIDYFLSQVGATHYLIWQFTVDAHDGDDYSFYQGDTLVCEGLKAAATAHPGQVGVNSWAIGKQPANVIDSAMGYLSSECGVSILRVWGTVGDPVSVVRAAANHGIKVIVVLGDYSNGSPGLPSFGANDPTNWYANDYKGEYRQNAQRIVGSITSAGLGSNVFAYELANEPHCSGFVSCITPYNAWAQAMALTVKGVDPSANVGIGQMGDHDTTRGDSPGPGDYTKSNSAGAIDVASAHYYTADERAKAIEAKSKTTKPFYIGEAPTIVSEGVGADNPIVLSSKPIPAPYVPCNEVRPIPGSENEFHSLRPYEASPCVEKLVDTIMYCGNNLYAKETFEVTPDDFSRCEEDGNGNLTCYDLPAFTSSIEADIEVEKSDLPILGNTQLVPNTINTVDALDNATRMNNYVSWYLNGAIYRAEDAIPTLSDVLAFAGPIRKLLPQVIQTIARQDQIDQAGVTRHNQVVTKQGQRLEQVNPTSDYAPFSSTEDRVGEVSVENKYPEGGFGGDTFYLKNIVFTPGGSVEFPSNRDDLYFAHTEESVQLAKVLQSTFASVDNPSQAELPGYSFDFKNTPARVKGFCDIKNYRTNPGDDLFGDYNNPNNPDYKYTEKINGTFTYTTDVYHGPVHFSPSSKVDDTCVAAGGTEESCTYFAYTPQKRYAYMALYVYLKSPKIKDIWERLVDGTAGVVGRFFPKEITLEDVPAGISAVYNARTTSGSKGDGVEAIAGTPYKPKDGEEALLYVPHLGSIQDYFLQGLQCALRPQGMCGNVALQQPSTVSASANSCTIDGSGIVSSKVQAIISNAASWSHVPISVLTMVVKNEAACPENAGEVSNFDPNSTTICEATDTQLEPYLGSAPQIYPRNCNFAASDKTRSRGPLQFQPTEWETWKSALSKSGNPRTPNICNIEDSIYAAAYLLSSGYGACPQSGYDVSRTPASWDLDHMKASLSRWAAGCSKPVCDSSITANRFYCGNIEEFNANIGASCQ